MSDNEYTPTMEQIEDGYAHDPESEYRDPVNYGSTVAANRRAFRRALEAHDREVAAKALRDWADFQERSLEQFAYVMDDCDRSETAEWCKAIRHYADRIETEPAAALGVPEEAQPGTLAYAQARAVVDGSLDSDEDGYDGPVPEEAEHG